MPGRATLTVSVLITAYPSEKAVGATMVTVGKPRESSLGATGS